MNTKVARGGRSKKIGGGTAVGGGVNFQAVAIAIVGVHMLRGTPLSWLDGVANDRPVAVWAESEGPGDDIRIELEGGRAAEIQVKKGLQRGTALWESLEAMAAAIDEDRLDFGLLVVAPDASRTISGDLSKDVERLGQGRCDHLTRIGAELVARLTKLGISTENACRCLRIRVVHGLDADNADVKAAKEALRLVCAHEHGVGAAWDALYRHAVMLAERRGRWTLRDLLRLLASVGIDIRGGDFPASILDRLTKWTSATNSDFQITGTRKLIHLKRLLPMRIVPLPFETTDAEDASAALVRYHQSSERQVNQTAFSAEWVARFRERAVIVAGPGLGKSTMMKALAHRYAEDGYPVLKVSLKFIAAALKGGTPFEDALMDHALSGSAVSRDQFERAGLSNLVVLADGLDDCGAEHHAVAEALK